MLFGVEKEVIEGLNDEELRKKAIFYRYLGLFPVSIAAALAIFFIWTSNSLIALAGFVLLLILLSPLIIKANIYSAERIRRKEK